MSSHALKPGILSEPGVRNDVRGAMQPYAYATVEPYATHEEHYALLHDRYQQSEECLSLGSKSVEPLALGCVNIQSVCSRH